MISHILLEDLPILGARLYNSKFRKALEKDFFGQFAVIDVESKKCQVDPDCLTAVEKARKEFGDKLFYIVQIGEPQGSNTNPTSRKYAWHL